MPSEKRARKRVQREKRRAKERRKEQLVGLRRRSVTIITVAVIAAAAYLILGFLSGDSKDLAEELLGQDVACGAERPTPVSPTTFDEPDDLALDPTAMITAVLVTSCGEITIEIDQVGAPETANSFVFLAQRGFYDGTIFHRIIDDFMVQGGDPTGTGTGGPGYRIPDEFPRDGFVYEPGVAAMANAGPGTTGSQFFIVSGAGGTVLEPRFNVLGKVASGFDAVRRIAEVEVVPNARGERSRPLQTVYLERVEIRIEP
jgi:peptidylprolyl isomerase